MSPRNIRLTIAFDGNPYNGWQKQKNAPSVQSALESVLQKVLHEKVKTIGAGRTDAGAHAIRYTLNFSVKNCSIPLLKLPQVLNTRLPDSIRVLVAREERKSFHARYSATAREYVYCLVHRMPESGASLPFGHQYCYVDARPMDGDVLRSACSLFPGTHDFRNFCYGYAPDMDFRRTVFYFRVRTIRVLGADVYLFFIKGNGFLKGMIRSVVSACLQAASGELGLEDIRKALSGEKELPSRHRAPVPAAGLYFKRAYYGTTAVNIPEVS